MLLTLNETQSDSGYAVHIYYQIGNYGNKLYNVRNDTNR